jgi:hypothetical protein
MTYYDYKVVPAPKRAKRVKGVHGVEDLFALTLTEAINEVARQGWEYVRAEHMPAESPGGWFRGASTGEQTVLVFRRGREQPGPRLASVRPEYEPAHEAPPVPPAERAVVDRLRREPVRLEPLIGDPEEFTATPLRPSPRLGPAEKP